MPRYAVLRDPGRVQWPGRSTPTPIVPPPEQPKPSARIIAFVPATPVVESVGAPRTVVTPQDLPPALLPSAAPASGVPAVSVGIVSTGGTTIDMVPADMWDGPRTNIGQFRILALAAGSWS